MLEVRRDGHFLKTWIWDIDLDAARQNVNWTKCQLDIMSTGQNVNSTKSGQNVNSAKSGQNVNWTKCQLDQKWTKCQLQLTILALGDICEF